MDQTLKDLKILARIPHNGRIRTSISGDIELEPESALNPVTRKLSSDSRRKALRDIQRIIKQAFEHADGILRSKYLNVYDITDKPTDTDIDQHQEECRRLRYLGNEMTRCIIGLNNLKGTTYKDDASFGAEVELIVRDIKDKINQINSRLERLEKRGTLPKNFPKPVQIRSQSTIKHNEFTGKLNDVSDPENSNEIVNELVNELVNENQDDSVFPDFAKN